MKRMECTCGKVFQLRYMPKRPFVSCPNCGRRLPVHCDIGEFKARCPKCGRFLDKEDLPLHELACTGHAGAAPETEPAHKTGK